MVLYITSILPCKRLAKQFDFSPHFTIKCFDTEDMLAWFDPRLPRAVGYEIPSAFSPRIHITSVGTCVGRSLSSLSPNPSWPWLLDPKANTAPLTVHTNVWLPERKCVFGSGSGLEHSEQA